MQKYNGMYILYIGVSRIWTYNRKSGARGEISISRTLWRDGLDPNLILGKQPKQRKEIMHSV